MNSFVSTLQQLGPARLGVMGAIVLGLMMFFVFLSMRISSPTMDLLYTDLSSTDSASIAAKLEGTQIPYDISPDGSRIRVSSDQVGRARMLLAAEGLPNGGSMGYEIFDEQSGFGTTNFVQNINQVRALEGELSRTISSIESVKSARVHLVLPQRELFSRDTRTASAGVTIGVYAGAKPEKQQIAAIQSLVASAVPDLKSSDVTVIDSNGNLLASGDADEDTLLFGKTEEIRRSLESRLKRKIEEQIIPLVGFNNVAANVTAEMNFDRISVNEELYNPDGQVLRSTQTTQESSSETEPAANDVSVGNNLPAVGTDLLAGDGPSAESARTEEVANYEISKTIRSTVFQSGDIEKLSVSVLIDHKPVTDAEGVTTFEPRTEDEMDSILELVRTSVGYVEERGDDVKVINMQFAQNDDGLITEDETLLFGFKRADIMDSAEIIVIAIMVILVVLLVLQPMVTKLMNAESSSRGAASLDDILQQELLATTPANPALAPPDPNNPQAIAAGGGQAAIANGGGGDDESLINVDGIEGKVKASTVKKVQEIVDQYPQEAVAVLRSWMAEEEA